MSPTVTAVIVVVVGMVLLGIIWAVMSIMRSTPADVSAGSGSARVARDQLRPILADFHVRGEIAEVYYAVPLPQGEIDDHLRDLLCHDASLVLHEKKTHGLPIEQVTRATVYGRLGEEPVEIGVIELEVPGEIPEIVAPELVPHASATGFDPLAHLGEQDFEFQPGLVDRESQEGLPPFLNEIVIAKSVEARLRAAGVDPTNVSLQDLSISLLRTAGYEVEVERAGLATPESGTAEMYRARKAGVDVLVVIAPHAEGEHPELGERTVNTFTIKVAQTSPQRALLITDKFGPYLVYEKERADPRCRFITRERLQAFVDGFAVQ
ncbi:MAG: hypothetical protein M3096_05410 [Actinomycetia bacterium]|nr:hypothetical protein [Actinomycetes bacterium]